jgi:hypothetical protein
VGHLPKKQMRKQTGSSSDLGINLAYRLPRLPSGLSFSLQIGSSPFTAAGPFPIFTGFSIQVAVVTAFTVMVRNTPVLAQITSNFMTACKGNFKMLEHSRQF